MARPKRAVSTPFDHAGCRIYPPTGGDPRWRVGIPDGKGGRRFRRAADHADALVVADKYAEVTAGYKSVGQVERTVADLCDAYLVRLGERVDLQRAGLEGGVSIKYWERQNTILKLHVKPVLGSLLVREWIDAAQSEKVLAAAVKKGNGKDGVQNIGSCMRAMVTFAHKNGWMPRIENPMAGVSYSRRSHRHGHNVNFIPRDTLPELDDIEAMVKGFMAIGEPRLALLVNLARCSGLRYGELLALRPCDINLADRIVRVDWQICQTNRMEFPRTLPKWQKTRTTLFVASLAAPLADLCDMVTLTQGSEGLLFPGEHKSGYIERKAWHRKWIRAAQAAGWEMKPDPKIPQWPVPKWSLQSLRHFAACWMLFDLKMDDADVAFHLGHYSSSFTRDQYIGVRGRPEERAKQLTEGW